MNKLLIMLSALAIILIACGRFDKLAEDLITNPNSTSALKETGITASDADTTADFGRSISLSSDGNIMAVGAYLKNTSKGKAYIYKWNGSNWVETGITASDGLAGDQFGFSVSLSSDGYTLAIGARGKNSNKGKAYIYKWNGSNWVETTGITASDSSADDEFGTSVSLSSDANILAVGAYSKNNYQGKVYIYKWNGSSWDETSITASDGATGDLFGASVSLRSDGNALVVGAYGKNNGKGKVYIYKWNSFMSNWDESFFTALDDSSGDLFGNNVNFSSDGNTLAVGAYGKNSYQGKAYIYKWNGSSWGETGITASDGVNNDWFGCFVSLNQDGKILAVAAGLKNSFQGKAYIYKWNGSSWGETGITASDGAANDYFSVVSLSSDGSTIAVGAIGKNNHQGKVYIYR